KPMAHWASGDSTVSFKLKRATAIYDIYSPALVGQAIDRYNKREGGRQTCATLLIPRVPASVTLRLEEAGRGPVNVGSMQFHRFRYALPGFAATVWVDADGRVCLFDLPPQKTLFVRAGYETLRRKPRSDPFISAPVHCIRVERDIGIPMRDG